MVTARFASVVDLPSSGAVLVTSSVRSGLSRLENWMFVRSVRYASAACDRGSRRAIRDESAWPFCDMFIHLSAED